MSPLQSSPSLLDCKLDFLLGNSSVAIGERGSNASRGGEGVRYRDGMVCKFFLKDVGMLALALSLKVDAPAGKLGTQMVRTAQRWSFRLLCSRVDIVSEHI